MPVVQKQTFKAATKTGGVLSRIQDINEMDEAGLKMLIYGKSKTGKTRLVCSFPKPLLLIGTEDGTKSIKGMDGVDFVRLQNADEMAVLVDHLKQGKYKSSGLDTAGGLSDMRLKLILGVEELPMQKSWGMASRESYGTLTSQMKEVLNKYLSLTETHGINIAIIAHERNFNDEGNTDALAPTVGAALTPSLTGWLNGAVDYICQTHIRAKMVESIQTVAGKQLKTLKPTGEKEFCLRVGPHEIFMTGFRLPPGQKLPEAISNPSYEKIKSLIDGTYKV